MGIKPSAEIPGEDSGAILGNDQVGAVYANIRLVALNLSHVVDVSDNMAELLIITANMGAILNSSLKATEAASSAAAAAASAEDAVSAKTAAEEAASGVEADRLAVETAAANALASANAADLSEADAEAAATIATTKAAEALASANSASTSETNAAASATAASNHADAAETSKNAASISETNAGVSAGNAAGSEAAAATSVTNANNAVTAAQAAQAAAEAARDEAEAIVGGDFVTNDLIGAANGIVPLGADSKISVAFFPDSMLGAVKYQGTWNATTNTPAIPAADAGNKGAYYKVAAAGTTSIDGEDDWQVGDWIISNGATWDKVDNSEMVQTIGDITGLQAALDAKANLAGGATFTGTLKANGGFTVAYGADVTLFTVGQDANANYITSQKVQPGVGYVDAELIFSGSTTSFKVGGVTKLQVTSTGITVTGIVVADGLKVMNDMIHRSDGNPLLYAPVGGGTVFYSPTDGGYTFNNSANLSKVTIDANNGNMAIISAAGAKINFLTAGAYTGEVRQGNDGFLYLSAGGSGIALYRGNYSGQIAQFSDGSAWVNGTFSVGDEAYGVTWNGSTNVPTKNAVYDKIESLDVAKKNKVPTISTIPTAATVTPTFSDDMVTVTALAAALQLLNWTGIPVDGWGLVVRIKDNGTARALTYDTKYRANATALPTTTIAGKTLYLSFIYNAADDKFDFVGMAKMA